MTPAETASAPWGEHMIGLEGLDGESVALDEAARDSVSTFREVQVEVGPGKRGKAGRYDLRAVLASRARA